MSAVERPCPYCDGAPGGCEECGHTGRRFTTFVDFDGGVMRVHGDAELSPEALEAIRAVGRAAYEQLKEEEQ